MTVFQDSAEIFTNETERKPNLYAARILVGVVAVIAIVCAMNETGVFTIDKNFVRLCLVFTLVQLLIARYITYKPALVSNPASKYVIMSMVLLLVLTVTVLLNIHAVLAFVLPVLLATQYRSHKISHMALLGACACCAVAPVLSYLLGTWNLNFLTGYIQTFCRVTISAVPGNGMTAADDIGQILLYWSLPQVLTLGAFGIILYSATRSGIDSVNNQMQVADLTNDLNRQLESIMTMQERMLVSMSDIIENRDVETGGHVRRTSEIVRLLTEAMKNDPESGVSDDFCEDVVKSAPMHDLGKISVPDELLRKPGRLTDEEFEIVRRHPQKSEAIIAQVLTGIEDDGLLETAKNIAKYHHERVDGKGYPEGLSGEQIPLEARIMAIADVYDALVSERCYKAAMPFEEAFEAIEQSMGTQFDAGLNRYFVACRGEIEALYG